MVVVRLGSESAPLAQEAIRHPLREGAFRALWSANMIANIGVWMQTVGGAWLMTTLTPDALPVALMQTATTLPAFLVGLPAGSLADRIDRRKLLLMTQAWMFVTISLLGVLTLLGQVTPWLLLLFTFALGTGAVMNAPTWAALLPDVVSRPQVPTAISVNGAGYNIARALGPAIGGFVVAAFGPAATFLLNALALAVSFSVVSRWRARAPREISTTPREAFVRTMVTGLQYTWQAYPQRIVLFRSVIWMVCAGALWGLLPLVARRELALDAPGYGLLVTCIGVGAVGGAFSLPRLRRRWAANSLLITSVVIFTALLLTLAWVRWVPAVCVMLALGGAAWTTSNQNFQIAVQMGAPAWVRARAIAAYLLTFQGGLAIGSAIWGAVAERTNDQIALTCASIGLGVGLLAALRWPVEDQR
ncbi:MAG TPA: MFS transporter [Chloroflexota bacterium]|jgi:MFS family permease|nr:MFS transporter [Chloroflexota bacterium]